MARNPYNGFSAQVRVKAMRWARAQYDAGRKVRPTRCQVCMITADQGKVMAHSEDYSEPFGPHIGEYAVCYRCHMVIHVRHKGQQGEALWNWYRAQVRAGYQLPPLDGRSFTPISDMLGGHRPEGRLVNTPRDRTFLDDVAEGLTVPSKRRPAAPPSAPLTLF